MTNESSHNTVTIVRQMAALTQQLVLLDLLENLLKATLQDGFKSSDISPLLKTLNDFAKARFDDPSFRLTWEWIATSLMKATERKELGDTKENNKYFKLIDDVERMLHQLALLDELISQQEQGQQ